MSEHPSRHHPSRALRRGLYLDARTTAPGCAHQRLVALALLPFTFAGDARIVEILEAEALSCPDPHRRPPDPHRAGADPRAPDIDLERASMVIDRAHLLVTHTRGFSRALLPKLLPGARETPWLEWELGVPALDGSLHRHHRASHGLDECRLGVWLLAQPLAHSSRSMLALMLDQRPDMPGRGPDSTALQ